MTLIDPTTVLVAYKKLKQMVYYETTSLFLRYRLAKFEGESNFDQRLDKVRWVSVSSDPLQEPQFQEWLQQIDFKLIPKSVKRIEGESEDGGRLLSNVTSEARYAVEKVNYLFDGPVELHLLAVLWLMVSGYRFDHNLVDNCYGSRLHSVVGGNSDHSSHLFRKYHELYAKWRDEGVGKAIDLLTTEKKNACIIALDLQEFYYRVQVDWDSMMGEQEKLSLPFDQSGHNLLKCIQSICETYRKKIADSLKLTHHGIPPKATCLPIGLCCSAVIANWHLNNFDRKILADVRPNYYGRYVDDILLVVGKAYEKDTLTVKQVMEDILVKTGLLTFNEEQGFYQVKESKGLHLQKKKCIVQYFDVEHSFAGLLKFRKKLQDNVSSFALLPSEEDESPVEQVAYDILYEGSENKLRSISEIAENRWELAKHLAKETQEQMLTSSLIKPKTKKDLLRFFKGRNAIEFWDMWERVFSFLIAGRELEYANEFEKHMSSEIELIEFEQEFSVRNDKASKISDVSRQLSKNLREHLEYSFSIARALRSSGNKFEDCWRQSNMIRHHLVSIPLLNYTKFEGDYISPRLNKEYDICDDKINRTPRYVHFDECMGFVDSWVRGRSNESTYALAVKLFEQIHRSSFDAVKFTDHTKQGEAL